jgi:glutaredoxin
MLIKFLRNALGYIIVLGDLMTRGFPTKRPPEAQQQVNAAAQRLTLYHFRACPFCVKVRRTMYKLDLPIAKKSVTQGSPFRSELEQGGGAVKVPCLRIEHEQGETQWLYESSAIIAYLKNTFSPS